MAERLSVLALDLATITGTAVWHPGFNEPRPHFGAVRLRGKGGEIGKSVEHLRMMLNELDANYHFTHVFFEAQHMPVPSIDRRTGLVKNMLNMETVYKLIALGAMVEWWCYRKHLPVFKVEIATWRKHFLGRGAAFGKVSMDPKEEAIRKCEAIGVYTDNHNCAEAVGILDYALTLFPDVVPPWRDKSVFERT